MMVVQNACNLETYGVQGVVIVSHLFPISLNTFRLISKLSIHKKKIMFNWFSRCNTKSLYVLMNIIL